LNVDFSYFVMVFGEFMMTEIKQSAGFKFRIPSG